MSGTEKESSHRDHIEAAEGINAIGFAVITLSDTRTEATDKSGACLRAVSYTHLTLPTTPYV